MVQGLIATKVVQNRDNDPAEGSGFDLPRITPRPTPEFRAVPSRVTREHGILPTYRDSSHLEGLAMLESLLFHYDSKKHGLHVQVILVVSWNPGNS